MQGAQRRNNELASVYARFCLDERTRMYFRSPKVPKGALWGMKRKKPLLFSFDAFTLKRKRSHITKALGFPYHDGFAVHITLGVTEHITKALGFLYHGGFRPKVTSAVLATCEKAKKLGS